MASQVEEILFAADSRHAEDLTPDAGHGLFERAPADLGRQAGGHRYGCRQSLPVDLSVGRERQSGQDHEGGRHHVVGQPFAQRPAQSVGPGVAGHIGHQPPVTGFVFARHHHRLADSRQRPQHLLDLARLDTETANLDLAVQTTEVLQGTVRPPPHPVARAVEPPARAGAEGVRHEPFGGQLRPGVIAVRQTVASQIELAGHSHRLREEPRGEDVYRSVGQRLPDGDGLARRHPCHPGHPDHPDHPMPGGEGRRLGRAVDVEQMSGRAVPQHGADRRRIDPLATEQHIAQRCEPGGRLAGDLVEQGGGQEQDADAFAAERGGQVAGRQEDRALDADQPAAVQERTPDLEGGGVKRKVGHLRHSVVRAELDIVGPAHQADDRAVRHHHSLRPAGRARGVDHVGGVVRRRGERGEARERPPRWSGLLSLFSGCTGRPAAEQLDVQARAGREPLRQMLLRDPHGGAGVFQHEGEPFPRIGKVERHVGPSCRQDAQHPHHPLRQAFRAEAHAGTGTDARGAEPVRQPARGAADLLIGELPAAEGHGHGVRRAFLLLGEQLVNRGPRIVPDRGVPMRQLRGLRGAQQVHLQGATLHLLDQVGEQPLEARDPPIDGRGVIEIGGVFDRSGKLAIVLL